jgi:uncharacterized membrane protein HdeD (DUF308 family)
MQKKKRKPSAAAGYLAIGIGVFCLVFSSHTQDMQKRYMGLATACMALSWGPAEVAAARKRKQDPEDSNMTSSYIFPNTTLFVLIFILSVLFIFLVRLLLYRQ